MRPRARRFAQGTPPGTRRESPCPAPTTSTVAIIRRLNAARLVSGAGAVVLNVLLTKMVMDWFEGRERVLGMSILINAWPIGIGIALLVAGPLAELVGWRWAIALTAVFAAAGFLTVWSTYRAPVAAPPSLITGIGLGVLTRREWRLLAVASLPWLLYNAAYQIIISFLPSFFLESGLSVARSGATTALNTVLFIVSVQAGGVILKRTKRPDLMCHVAIIGWCATLLLLSGGSLPVLWIVLGGLVGGFPASAFVALPSEFLRPESRGAGMGCSTPSTTWVARYCQVLLASFMTSPVAPVPRCG